MLKQTLSKKLSKIRIALDTPGALRARLGSGILFDYYQTFHRLQARSVDPATILDIGAYEGCYSACARYFYPDAMIYAFEPIRECYQALLRRASTFRKVKCYNIALGNVSGKQLLRKSRFRAASSILEASEDHIAAFPDVEFDEMESVNIKKLDQVLDGVQLNRPVLMKLDVQGYEDVVLDGALAILNETDFIVTEMSFSPQYIGQVLFDELYSKIKGFGFKFEGPIAELRNPETSELMQIDGFFSRR